MEYSQCCLAQQPVSHGQSRTEQCYISTLCFRFCFASAGGEVAQSQIYVCMYVVESTCLLYFLHWPYGWNKGKEANRIVPKET